PFSPQWPIVDRSLSPLPPFDDCTDLAHSRKHAAAADSPPSCPSTPCRIPRRLFHTSKAAAARPRFAAARTTRAPLLD
ncbi:hypothetical protein PMAYCL1PPCAC_05672, partial [Pristionchus mayeri]